MSWPTNGSICIFLQPLGPLLKSFPFKCKEIWESLVLQILKHKSKSHISAYTRPFQHSPDSLQSSRHYWQWPRHTFHFSKYTMLGPWERHSMELPFPNRSQAAGLIKRHNGLFKQLLFKWQCVKRPPTCVSHLPQALISPNLRPIGWLTSQRNFRKLPYHYFLYLEGNVSSFTHMKTSHMSSFNNNVSLYLYRFFNTAVISSGLEVR